MNKCSELRKEKCKKGHAKEKFQNVLAIGMI